MWIVSGREISMTEGDYGIQLPIKVNGITFGSNDEVLFTLKYRMNGDTVFTKSFANVSQNTINLEITAGESALLGVGAYVYSLDWLQSGMFMCNIVPSASFRVVEKA